MYGALPRRGGSPALLTCGVATEVVKSTLAIPVAAGPPPAAGAAGGASSDADLPGALFAIRVSAEVGEATVLAGPVLRLASADLAGAFLAVLVAREVHELAVLALPVLLLAAADFAGALLAVGVAGEVAEVALLADPVVAARRADLARATPAVLVAREVGETAVLALPLVPAAARLRRPAPVRWMQEVAVLRAAATVEGEPVLAHTCLDAAPLLALGHAGARLARERVDAALARVIAGARRGVVRVPV